MRIFLFFLLMSTVLQAPAASREKQSPWVLTQDSSASGISASGISTSGISSWLFPVQGAGPRDISRGFDLPTRHSHVGHGHRGVDFPARPGTAIYAVGAGIVHFVGRIAGKPTLSINHGVHPRFGLLPIRSTYEPVASILSPGDYVQAGQKIGYTTLGSSHCQEKCLHLGLKVEKDRYINPILLWPYPSSLLSSARG